MKQGRALSEVLTELQRQNAAKQDFIGPAQAFTLRPDSSTFESAGAGWDSELPDPGRRPEPVRSFQCHHKSQPGCRILRPGYCFGGHRVAGGDHASGTVERDQ